MARTRKPGDPHVAIAYLRASTDEQQLGLDAQRYAIEQWAAAHGVRVVSYEVDPGVSGGTPLEKRPGLQRAIAALRSAGAGFLLVAKRDRLARDVVIAAMVERAVVREGAQLFSVDGIGNGAGPADMLMRTMLDGVAQFEKAIIQKRIKDALALKKTRGECTGGVPPYGMQLASDKRHLEPNPEELETIRRARELAKSGLSYRQIMRTLAEAGRFNRRGKIFDLKQIGRMVAGVSTGSPRLPEPVAACGRGHVHQEGADAIGAFCKEGACGFEAGKPLPIRRIAWRSIARAS
jgi:DNA invertase Pin-like site-specific DNA recombinase